MLVNHRTACFGKMLLLILILQISHASSGTFTESFVLSVIATIASLSMEPSPETALVASASVSLIPLWRDYGYPYFFPTPLEKAINKFKQQKFLIDKDNHELWFLLKPWKDLYKSDAAKKIPIKKMIEGAVHIFSGEIEEHRGKKGLSNAQQYMLAQALKDVKDEEKTFIFGIIGKKSKLKLRKLCIEEVGENSPVSIDRTDFNKPFQGKKLSEILGELNLHVESYKAVE